MTQEDVFDAIEPVIEVFKVLRRSICGKTPFPQFLLTRQCLNGSDKPDLRNPLLIADVTNIFRVKFWYFLNRN